MIQRVSLRNFKSLREVDLQLERLTVLVGANASGKSSVLQALEFLKLVLSYSGNDFGHVWRAARRLRSSDLGPTFPVSVGILNATEFGEAELTVSFRERREYSLEAEVKLVTRDGWKFEQSDSLDSVGRKLRDALVDLPALSPQVDLLDQIQTLKSLRLDGDVLSEASPLSAEEVEITRKGFNFVSMLTHLQLNDPDAWEGLQVAVRKVITPVRRLRFGKASYDVDPAAALAVGEISNDRVRRESPRQGYELLIDYEHVTGVPASRSSEGTLLVIAVLAVLFSPSQPDLVLIDDVEKGLHPTAVREFVAQLRHILKLRPSLQIIATTHSPYLLDSLRPEEVRAVSLDESGRSVVAHLTAHKDFEKWKGAMMPGEFWSHVGEKWVTQSK